VDYYARIEAYADISSILALGIYTKIAMLMIRVYSYSRNAHTYYMGFGLHNIKYYVGQTDQRWLIYRYTVYASPRKEHASRRDMSKRRLVKGPTTSAE
jgi:hypothetical protein